MSRIEKLSWGIAIMLSFSLHAMLLFQHGKAHHAGLDEQHQAARKVTRMSFHTVKAPQPEKQPIKPQEKVTNRDKSEKERPYQQIPEQKEQQEVQEEVAPSEQITQSQEVDEQLQAQLKRDYIGVLLAHIERHKYYPRSARRRGLEGKVMVKFIFREDGTVHGLHTSGSHNILQQAAEDAVTKALPLPTPPNTMRLPITLEFSILYRLNV